MESAQLSDGDVFSVPAAWAGRARMDRTSYEEAVARVESDPDGYWRDLAGRLDWVRAPTETSDVSFNARNVRIRWYADGVLNASANCLDRHLEARGDQVALIWENDGGDGCKTLTYRQLHAEVCRWANVLKARGVRKGDRVTIYLPMIPAAAASMLACARIGAVHSVIFSGFAPQNIAARIRDCGSRLVITADEGLRGGKILPLKRNVDEALKACPQVTDVIVVRRTNSDVPMTHGRDAFYPDLKATVSDRCDPEPMGAEEPLFVLHPSASAGEPRGVLHATGGYLAWAAHTHELVFDCRPGEIFWCTEDLGWASGHSYVLYGPLANGATTLMFEGAPDYPNESRVWEVVDKHKVETFCTAPAILRALMRNGDAPVERTSRASLRLLGTVGEPIASAAWYWYFRVVGEERCPIVDTYLQAGACLASPLPGAIDLKPGSCGQPLPGVKLEVVDTDGKALEGSARGDLCIVNSWPGQAQLSCGDLDGFVENHFSIYPGRYFTGDSCRRDEDGYYWITGRADDVINLSERRLGSAEIESALASHPDVAEAAAVGFPHNVKGQGIHCFVTLHADVTPTDILQADLRGRVRREIGAFAVPDLVQFVSALPKSHSGKIMRHILRKIAENDLVNLGDTTYVADPSVVDDLVASCASGG